MNAIQPSRPPLRPVEPIRRQAARPRPRQQGNPHQAIAAGFGVKLAVNIILSIASVTALVKLIPQNLAQKQELAELHTEVVQVEQHVSVLQADFSRRFDPQQARSIMQEQSSRVDPEQRPIVWVNPPTTTAKVPHP